MNKCCICGKPYEGIGNNALPLAEGRCCGICNADHVIPFRFAKLTPKRLTVPIPEQYPGDPSVVVNMDTKAVEALVRELPSVEHRHIIAFYDLEGEWVAEFSTDFELDSPEFSQILNSYALFVLNMIEHRNAA